MTQDTEAVKNSLIRFLQKNNFYDARSAGEALKILLALQKTPSYPAKHKEEDWNDTTGHNWLGLQDNRWGKDTTERRSRM